MKAHRTAPERESLQAYIQADEAYGIASDARDGAKRALLRILGPGWYDCGRHRVRIQRHGTSGGVLRYSIAVVER